MVANEGNPTVVEELEGSEVDALPAGAYVAQLTKIEAIATRSGQALKWHWLVARSASEGGDFLLSSMTSTYLTRGSNANAIIRVLRGTPLAPGEKLRVEQIEGRTALLLVVVDPESGYNKVREVSAPPVERTQQPVEAMDPEEAALFAPWQAARATGQVEG